MTAIDDPKLVVRNLLVDEWNDANTLGVRPRLDTGWRDADLTEPVVTVSTDEESPTSPTGFTGIKPDGSGPTAETRGTVQVDAWANREVVDENPKQLVSECSKEVKRVIRANLDPSTHTFTLGGLDADNYRYLSWFGRTFLPDEPDADDAPIDYRYLCTIRYEYLDEPP